jgi:predicted DNA-binding transcriptional regulator AlpA
MPKKTKVSKGISAQPPHVLDDAEIVRFSKAPPFFGVGKSKLREMVVKGEVPRPMRLGPRSVGWTLGQIRQWQRQLMSE